MLPYAIMSRPDIQILLVEEDRRVREALTALLTASPGFAVIAASGDALTALHQARELRPDVSVVDLRLPDEAQGLALVRQLRDSGLTVVAMSAHDSLAGRALFAGAAAFVSKGSEPEVLLATMHTITSGATQLRNESEPSTPPGKEQA